MNISRAQCRPGVLASILVLFAIQPVVQYRFGLLPGSMALVGAVLVMGFRRTDVILKRAVAGPTIVLFTVIPLSLTVSLFGGRSVEDLWSFLTIGLILVAAPVLSPEGRVFTQIWFACLCVILINGLAVIMQALGWESLFGLLEGGYSGGRYSGFHYNSNGSALFVAMSLAAVVVGCVSRNPIIRNFSYVFSVGGIAVVYSLGSRGAIMGILCALGIVLWLKSRQRLAGARSWSPILAGIGFSVVVVWSILLRVDHADMASRVLSAMTGRGPMNFENEQREAIWATAVEAVRERPFIGGADTRFPYGVNNAHSAFLDMAVNHGLIVTFAFGAFLVLILKMLSVQSKLPSPKSDNALCGIAILACVLGYSFTHLGLVNNAFLWLCVASCLSYASVGTGGKRDNLKIGI